jgi:hypothetical protein
LFAAKEMVARVALVACMVRVVAEKIIELVAPSRANKILYQLQSKGWTSPMQIV